MLQCDLCNDVIMGYYHRFSIPSNSNIRYRSSGQLSAGEEGSLSELFCAVLCTATVYNYRHTHEQFLHMNYSPLVHT